MIMSDVVVTVPKWFWPEWIAEGDAAGDAPSGEEWIFTVPTKPDIFVGERVYIVSHGKLRGYPPLVKIVETAGGKHGLIRAGGAVAVTIPDPIKGFQGYRYRWWMRQNEIPFPEWRTP